ncbi:STE3-domain-containing protein [Daedaleopsis nitida]|nr:STE3-domain-containing protein [Daedaleopsis nitida]
MRTELPVVSFVCLGLLAVLSPVFLHSRNVAVLSLVAWLVCCNLIHGINALLWAGNEVNHAPVWCDITTRVVLAAQMALPGCALVLARRLRRCAIGQEVTQKTYTSTQDLTFTLIVPIIYIVLHVIVQPHRFDIAADFGCTPSIYTSSVAIILVWIPPLALCIATFAYASLAIRGRLDSSLVFFSHMQDSPRLNILAFIRPLFTSLLVTAVVFSTTVVSLYARVAAIGGLQMWSVDKWDVVHAHMTEVFVIAPTSRFDLIRVEVEWWVVPACSFVVIGMTALGLVCRATGDSGYQELMRWFRTNVLRYPARASFFNSTSNGFRGEMISSTPSSPTLVGDRESLVDVWTPAAPWKVKLRAQLSRLAIPETPQSSASSCASPDDPFVKSTMTYIESPTGREALGLPPLPPALYLPPPRKPAGSPASAPATTTSPASKSTNPVRPARPESILSAESWPRPPSTVPTSPTPRTPSPKLSVAPINVQPPSPTPARALDHASSYAFAYAYPSVPARPESVMSIPTSLASSTLSMSGYYDDSLEPHVVPFQDHLDLEARGAGHVLAVPKHLRRMRSRDVLPRNLSARERRRQGSDGLSGGIYMTVVKETV